jgi:hypothetical protein
MDAEALPVVEQLAMQVDRALRSGRCVHLKDLLQQRVMSDIDHRADQKTRVHHERLINHVKQPDYAMIAELEATSTP